MGEKTCATCTGDAGSSGLPIVDTFHRHAALLIAARFNERLLSGKVLLYSYLNFLG